MPTGQRELAECWGFGAGVWFKYEVAQFRIPICESPSRLRLEAWMSVVTGKDVMTIAWGPYGWRGCDKLVAKWGRRVGVGGSRWVQRGARPLGFRGRQRASESTVAAFAGAIAIAGVTASTTVTASTGIMTVTTVAAVPATAQWDRLGRTRLERSRQSFRVALARKLPVELDAPSVGDLGLKASGGDPSDDASTVVGSGRIDRRFHTRKLRDTCRRSRFARS